MALFQKGNKQGNRFTSENQPQGRGRKPSLYKVIKQITGKNAETQLSREDFYKIMQWIIEQDSETVEKLIKSADGRANKKTPLWLLNMVSAINSDIRYGRTTTIEMILDRIFGKSTQPIESEVNATVENKLDLSGLSTDELLQYNTILEKIRKGNGTK